MQLTSKQLHEMANVRDIKPPLCERDISCENPATKRVNLKGMASYMEMTVCRAHIEWAIEHLYQYMPKDR